MAAITDLTTLAITDLTASDLLPIHDISAGTDKKMALYASGTWTPALRFGGGTTGVTYSARTAYYARIGPVVYVIADIRLSSIGAYTTEAADIGGLPYVSVNSPNGAVSCRWATTASSYVHMCGIVPSSDSTIDLYGATAAVTTLASVTASGLGNSAIIQLAGFYFA